MKIINIFVTFIFATLIISCKGGQKIPAEILQEYPSSIVLHVANEAGIFRADEAVILKIDEILAKYPDFNPQAFVIFHKEVELPSQMLDINADGKADQLICIADFNAGETKKMVIQYSNKGVKPRLYAQRTQAELSHKIGGEFQKNKEGRFEYVGGTFKNVDYLRVPPQHSDHSFFIRYEGPGWESDKIGYRFYLDWRNASDIFGKKTADMVLQGVGQDGFDSYHELSAWGMDILKVGEALGIGAIGMFHEGKVERVSKTDSVNCQIVANGPIYSQIRTRYFGWLVGDRKYDLISDLSICAGSRITQHTVSITSNPDNLCTGIVKHEGISVMESSAEGQQWEYLATYGQQSLAGDKLGMAVIFQKDEVIETTDDMYNWVVVLRPVSGQLNYYFLAAWEQEPGGIQTQEEFAEYLNSSVQKLNKPLKISL
jgi:hypothetical protein